MEVDQGDQESERPTASNHFFLGTPDFNQRLPGGEVSRDNGKSASTEPIDASPLGPTLPTSMSPQVLGPNLINPQPPPPPTARTARDPDRSDAMAAEIERIFQQKEKEKEEYNAVLKQKDDELA